MFIDRTESGSIRAAFVSRQHERQEEILDNSHELFEFRNHLFASRAEDKLPPRAYPFRICAAASVPPNAGTASFNNNPYDAGGIQWNFPVTVFPGTEFWVTDLHFQSKMVRHPDNPIDDRSSYAVFFAIMTMTEHCSFASYRSPIRLPAGFVISGSWYNQSAEPQNMIAAMHGYVVPLGA